MSVFPDTTLFPIRGRRPSWRHLLLVILLFLFSLTHPATSKGEDFSITSFHVDMEVRSNSSLHVKERIETVFHRQRHGLYRDIPIQYVDDLGKKSVTPIKILSVTDNAGKGWKYRARRRGGYLRVRIGNPREYIKGTQVFVIRYRVENGILFFPDHDELYWNVTGNEWPVSIDRASATIRVPDTKQPISFQTRCFTGYRGSRDRACKIETGRNEASFISTHPFSPLEGMTIVLGWEKGVVHPPGLMKKFFLSVKPLKHLPLLIPILTLLYMLRLWYLKGKDPSTGDPLVVAYTPPEEGEKGPLLPAEAGILNDEKLNPSDITASVIDLAVKGFLKIQETKIPGILFDKTDYLLRKEEKDITFLPHFESLLLEKLFESHGTSVHVSELKLKFYKHLDELKKTAFEGMAEKGYFSGNPLKVKSSYIFRGGAILISGGLIGWIGGMVLHGMTGLLALSIIISGLIVILFAPLMPVKTMKGVRILEKVQGFEEFLMRAEKERLERMSDKNLFEKYLPYAIALGVSHRWANAFEGISQDHPEWYISGEGIGTFHPATFHHSLTSALSTMSTAMTSSPRSSGSGFSGGGSSGGGGGGGGGGSW